MATAPLDPATRALREGLRERGGASAQRCYQCATCSSVCELATPERPFPRRQMTLAQWGMGDEIVKDPALWLCHNCGDCTDRCPRDARPGDVMQALRAHVVERLAMPGLVGMAVGRASSLWPALIGLPIALWVIILTLFHGFTIPTAEVIDHASGELRAFAYHDFVPHVLIYAVYFTAVAIAAGAVLVSAIRFWNLLGEGVVRQGSFLKHLWAVAKEIATHKRFGSCGVGRNRRWGHWLLLWGFVIAAAVSGAIVVMMYGFGYELPLAQDNLVKIGGNVGAVFLVIGGLILLVNRARDEKSVSTAFDNFFLGVVLTVIATGVVTEIAREAGAPIVGCWTYVVHLGAVLCLFITFPYSKFAHMLYRTLTMVHERMANTGR